jgi:hypothetical protein
MSFRDPSAITRVMAITPENACWSGTWQISLRIAANPIYQGKGIKKRPQGMSGGNWRMTGWAPFRWFRKAEDGSVRNDNPCAPPALRVVWTGSTLHRSRKRMSVDLSAPRHTSQKRHEPFSEQWKSNHAVRETLSGCVHWATVRYPSESRS